MPESAGRALPSRHRHRVTPDFVGTTKFNGKDVLTVRALEALTTLTAAAFHDISHPAVLADEEA